MSTPWSREMRATLRLATPVVTAQVGMMAMGVVDVAMIGRVSGEELAATALGHVFSFGVLIFGLGMMQALDPLVSQAVGAQDHRAIRVTLQRSAILAVILAVVAGVISIPAAWVYEVLHQPEEAIPVATGYVHASIPGYLPFFLFVILRQSLQAFSRTRAILVTVLIANVINVGLNWVLIFGHAGMPEMGAVGCAWATTICRWLMAILLLGFGWRDLHALLVPHVERTLDRAALWRLARLGAPIGAALTLEYGAFMATLLLMGLLGTTEVAGHQVAINLASLSFMFPMGIGAAASVRVGYAVGRGDPDGTRRAAYASLTLGAGVMVVFAIAFLLAPTALAACYTDQPEVIAMAALLIPIAGIFQVLDGVQVVASGALRGAGDTRTPMIVHFIGFWVVGLPIGAYLTFQMGMAPAGPWWGLVIGLALVAVILVHRVRRTLASQIDRVHI